MVNIGAGETTAVCTLLADKRARHAAEGQTARQPSYDVLLLNNKIAFSFLSLTNVETRAMRDRHCRGERIRNYALVLLSNISNFRFRTLQQMLSSRRHVAACCKSLN